MAERDRRDVDNSNAEALEAVTRALIAMAKGEFDVQVPRSYSGDDWDVLAFLTNSTADEVAELVAELHRERDELARTQARLIETEKLAALGRLAAGVAHELNQPLTVIRGITQLLRREPDGRLGDHDPDLALMLEAARQMSKIVASIRTFGNDGPVRLEPTPALAALKGAHSLLAGELSADGVLVSWETEANLPLIRADIDRLRQVFINLITNARHALSEDGVREPRIDLVVTRHGDELEFRVSDNGPGIARENQAKLFEPFFSTKDAAQGTGLGLSVAHGIVVEHGGSIAVDPAPETGACFVVTLPHLGRNS